MTLTATESPGGAPGRLPTPLIGGWEAGLLVFMVALYFVGVAINPQFFGSADALHSVLRDASRFGIMAVGMVFVIVNKDLDLSVGSIVGLVAIVFSICYAPTGYDMGVWSSILIAMGAGMAVGLLNGIFIAYLQVPAFIGTLTMLFVGRGFVLGLSGGRTIGFTQKAETDWVLGFGADNWLGFNNQIIIFAVVALIGAIVMGYTRWGAETYATGGNAQAADYSGISTRWVRMRAYLMSAFCASLAGLMLMAQDTTVTSQYGQGNELIVIAAVIVGGASILGGRGRVAGACLGAILVVLIDKVLREGFPSERVMVINDIEMTVRTVTQLPPGAVPAFLGAILLIAVLLEPYVIRRKVIQRVWARLRNKPLPAVPETGGVAIEGAQTRGTRATASFARKGIAGFLQRRDSAAIMLVVVLWLTGLLLRPDFWGSLDNTFNLVLAMTEIAILSIGLTFVIANGDIDLSVGSVLALSGATAAFLMNNLGVDPGLAVLIAFAAGTLAGVVNGALVTRFGIPAFVATLGMFYMARGIGAWMVAGRQLSGFDEGFVLLGRKFIEVLAYWNLAPPPGTIWHATASAISTQSLIMMVLALVAGIVLGYTPIGQMVLATGGNRRAADYAGINTNRVRFWSLVFSSMCAALAGIIYIAYLRSFNPSAGQLRELDGIAAVIIGGGSIFGGYASVLGSLAGAAAITLLRSLLSLQVFIGGESFVMPQHWVNVFIGAILIGAVLADIWIRQYGILAEWSQRLGLRSRRKDPQQ